MLTERVRLLGTGLYKTIPDEIEISSIPTASELEYVSAEDFDSTMVRKIFPKVISNSDKMDFMELLDIDYDWICRCLRFKSFGPYFTVNNIFCRECGKISTGQYEVDLRTVNITPLPKGFVNNIRISSDEFMNVKDDIVIKLMTVQDNLALQKDTLFDRSDGSKNNVLGNICYSIKEIGSKTNLTPVDVRSYILSEFSPADYEILKDTFGRKVNYGLEVSGKVTCPKCGSESAYFIAFSNDKFFRPSMGDVRSWQSAVRSGESQELLGDPSGYVRADN